MNIEKLTDRSKAFLQNAQTLASRKNNQFITPQHLLKVMLDDKEGFCVNLIAQTGADVNLLINEVDKDLAGLPSVEGQNIEVRLSNDFMKVIDNAEQLSEKAGDKFVTVERLLQVIFLYKKYNVDSAKLNQVINNMRQLPIVLQPKILLRH